MVGTDTGTQLKKHVQYAWLKFAGFTPKEIGQNWIARNYNMVSGF